MLTIKQAATIHMCAKINVSLPFISLRMTLAAKPNQQHSCAQKNTFGKMSSISHRLG